MDCSTRGVRGAINIERNDSHLIIEETKKLLLEMVKANNIEVEDICSIIFTMTPDLNAAFPAYATRDLGWKMVPNLCAVEIDVAESLSRCIRVLMHVNTPLNQKEIKHVYLKEAQKLRDDL